jgi:hypothetical protein
MYKKVLLAYDGSIEGRLALREVPSSHNSVVPMSFCWLLSRFPRAPG